MILQKTMRVSALAIMVLGGTACGGGSSSSSSGLGASGGGVSCAEAPAASSNVTISGKITFDHVPFNTNSNGLNYNATTQDPTPGVTVEVLGCPGNIIQSTVTNAAGDYSIEAPQNTDVRIRVKAEMVQTSGAQWNVRVIDNTSSNALYSVQGALASSGTSNSTRNLNAGSGWGGNSYTSARAAAPFAILAPIYESIQRVVAVDPDVFFPPANFNWSINNRPVDGNIADGEIYSSSYRGNGTILILGRANNDTDEYDEHIVIHEWGHYFEDQLSRSDSVGGEHGPEDRLDPRVALGEGFGNALSGMMTDDPFYRDSGGASQGLGFEIDVESNSYTNEGWFNEGSVQSILYDIYDSHDDGSDTISAGFRPIYNVLTSSAYKEIEYFTTIFTFLEQYRVNNAGEVTGVDALATAQTISVTDAAGSDETNTGSVAASIPLYKRVAVNGGSVEICSITAQGYFNKLGNRTYLVFDVESPGAHTFTMSRKSGARNRDPDFTVHRANALLGTALSGVEDTERASINLTIVGQHIIDAYDDRNNSLADSLTGNEGDACYDFTITR